MSGLIILIIFIGYLIYLSKLEKSECDLMNTLYPTINGYIKPISAANPDCSGNLFDYYIKTAYNACSGGSYKNDYVDICVLKAIIKEGTEVGEVQEIEQDILERVFHIGDRKINSLMTHRSDIEYLSLEDTAAELKAKAGSSKL